MIYVVVRKFGAFHNGRSFGNASGLVTSGVYGE